MLSGNCQGLVLLILRSAGLRYTAMFTCLPSFCGTEVDLASGNMGISRGGDGERFLLVFGWHGFLLSVFNLIHVSLKETSLLQRLQVMGEVSRNEVCSLLYIYLLGNSSYFPAMLTLLFDGHANVSIWDGMEYRFLCPVVSKHEIRKASGRRGYILFQLVNSFIINQWVHGIC